MEARRRQGESFSSCTTPTLRASGGPSAAASTYRWEGPCWRRFQCSNRRRRPQLGEAVGEVRKRSWTLARGWRRRQSLSVRARLMTVEPDGGVLSGPSEAPEAFPAAYRAIGGVWCLKPTTGARGRIVVTGGPWRHVIPRSSITSISSLLKLHYLVSSRLNYHHSTTSTYRQTSG